jgi:hypothetical protein
VIAAYRRHPFHGQTLSQDLVSGWLGITQAQLSRIENGPPVKDLDRLIFCARTLGIPAGLLWFKLPEDVMERRDVLRVGTSVVGALAAGCSARSPRLAELARLVAFPAGNPGGGVKWPGRPNLHRLSVRVANARAAYQATNYGRVVRDLHDLLTELAHAADASPVSSKPLVQSLLAQAYQVASGVLLKLDDAPLAAFAAERSVAAAARSDDPVQVASSSRAAVHALCCSGHAATAAELAVEAGQRLWRDAPHSLDMLSVYGALLLRAALSTASLGDRGRTTDLLDEADDAARRVGRDANLQWTAFGPTNVLLHRVTASVRLGDTGSALDTAARVDLTRVAVAERKAALHIEAATAFVQAGQYGRALAALQAAEVVAAEEVRTRPAVIGLVATIANGAPPNLRGPAWEYARSLGAVS